MSADEAEKCLGICTYISPEAATSDKSPMGDLVGGRFRQNYLIRGVVVATRENTVVQVNPQTNNGSLVPGNPTPLYLVVLIEAAIMVGGNSF